VIIIAIEQRFEPAKILGSFGKILLAIREKKGVDKFETA